MQAPWNRATVGMTQPAANNTELAKMTGLILSVDLGKFQSTACIYFPDGKHSFCALASTREELTALLLRVRPHTVVIEACALAGWVHDLCQQLGFACEVANTAAEAWKFKHLKRKTDKDDALRLVEIYRLGKFPIVHLPPKEIREQRGLIEMRQKLVGRRVAL